MAGEIKKDIMKRMLALTVIVVMLFTLDGLRLFYIQIIKGDEYSAKAESQQLSDTEIPAIRGNIYDSNGNVLAQSATVWDIFLDPGNITEKTRDVIVNGLSDILKLDEEGKAELLEKSKKETRYVVVAEKVENDIKEKVSEFIVENKKLKLSTMIGSVQNNKRYYPYGSFASSVIGYTGGDNQGLYGLEYYYEDVLKGTGGRIITVKDAQKNKLPTDYETSIDAINGSSLKLTINQTIQYYLEKGLRTTMEEYQCKGAYGVVMNCNTGAVLGMASLPDFDCNCPNVLTYDKNIAELEKITDKEEYKEAQSLAIQNQWSNFTVSGTYEPGSVFKTFMACAALEEGVATLDTSYTCTGSIQVANYKMNCHYHPGHGTQNFTQGLENSCNPFFITIGQRLGAHNYFKYFEAFGFTDRTGIDLPGEARSQYYKENEYGIVQLSSASFGQSNNLTPIQICTGICAIANGGKLLKPYVVDSIIDQNGNTIQKTSPTEVRRVISEDTSAKVRNMMKSVVDNGTGKNGYVAGYSVGGKTGTSTKLAESDDNKTKYIVSFAAIAPTDNPQIAMLIICDEPNQDLGGGALCAPIAAHVVEQAMSELNIEPRYTEEEAKNISITTPKVVGGSLASAKATLESHNLRYKVVGEGDKVLRQSPVSTSTIPVKGIVVLYTDDTERKTTKVPDFIGCTINEANNLAADYNLNLEITGNDLNASNIVAYRQSTEKDTVVEYGSVVTVSFKNTNSVLD